MFVFCDFGVLGVVMFEFNAGWGGEFWVSGLSLFGWFEIRQACCVVVNFCLNTSGLSV